jgi:FAD-dependent urate hydroxylase
VANIERVIVIGGGIAGLSATLALRRAGVDATLYERDAELSEVGTGVQLWLNGVRALQELGVRERIERAGAPVQNQSMRSWRRGTLFDFPLGDMAREHGHPRPLIVRRPPIIEELAAALDDGAVVLGAELVSIDEDDAGVTANFADGRSERGAVLIGADGIRSTVRGILFPEVSPRYAGYQYLRAMTQRQESHHPEGETQITFGRGDRFGFGDIGGGQIYWYAIIVTPEGSGDDERGRKGELVDRYREFPDKILATIEATPDESIGRTDIYDLKPMPSWGRGRVMLIGDAAHATTPNLGRGASEGIEDAVVLARALGAADLADGSSVTASLRSFEEQRRPATAKIQSTAWRIGKAASWSDPVRCRVREAAMRRIVSRALPKQALADMTPAPPGDSQPVSA